MNIPNPFPFDLKAIERPAKEGKFWHIRVMHGVKVAKLFCILAISCCDSDETFQQPYTPSVTDGLLPTLYFLVHIYHGFYV